VKIIDIGVPLDAAPYPPWNYRFKRVSHEEGARAMLRLFKGSDVGDYPDSMALGWETITLTGHAGNHIDAPWHFGPLCEGKPARTIDQIPSSGATATASAWIFGIVRARTLASRTSRASWRE